jgi:hypothetical protein
MGFKFGDKVKIKTGFYGGIIGRTVENKQNDKYLVEFFDKDTVTERTVKIHSKNLEKINE